MQPLPGPAHGQYSHQCPEPWPQSGCRNTAAHGSDLGCSSIPIYWPAWKRSSWGNPRWLLSLCLGMLGTAADPVIPGPSLLGPGQDVSPLVDLAVRRKQCTLIFGGILQDPVKSVCREGSCFVLSFQLPSVLGL